MPTEIEAKMKVPGLEPIRQKLRAAGATRLDAVLETNRFFDNPDLSLRKQDRGLRIRVAISESGKQTCTITMKGPMQAGQFKTREELEFTASNPEMVAAIFEHLGYTATLSFQKRRESWSFDQCEVELDEMPYLGTYVEIEGKTDAIVAHACAQLGLAGLPLISSGYISLLSRYLDEHKIAERNITF